MTATIELSDSDLSEPGVAIADDLSSLQVEVNGATITIPAARLRAACKCAHCTRARFDDRFPDIFPGIAIVSADNLGYGLNLTFSDGHNRGIYPWGYLESLGRSSRADTPA
jgi:DUF971 family protein